VQGFELNGAEEILSYNNGMTAGAVNSYGKGKAVILGTYIGHNGNAYRNDASHNFVRKLLSLAGVEYRESDGVNIRERCADGKKAFIVFNTTDEIKKVSLPKSGVYLDAYNCKVFGGTDVECAPMDMAVVVFNE
jgi:hypothetical protein